MEVSSCISHFPLMGTSVISFIKSVVVSLLFSPLPFPVWEYAGLYLVSCYIPRVGNIVDAPKMDKWEALWGQEVENPSWGGRGD